MISDGENEKEFVSTEEEEADGSRSYPTHFRFVTKRGRISLADLKQPRQKYNVRWERDFPWLKSSSDNGDECVGYCTVCNKNLVYKKSHLERHQRSFKHQRLQAGFEVLDETTQPTATEFLECGKREAECEEYEELENAIEMDPEYSVEFELNPGRTIKREVAMAPKVRNPRGRPPLKRKLHASPPNAHPQKSQPTKLDRFKLLNRIDRDRNELNEYFYGRQMEPSPPPPPLPQRDSFDLFFESVSASVKTLPPKLAAEVKSRVSQILAEFELRAICEREVMESSADVASSTHELKSSYSESAHGHIDGTSVPQICYTFQPRLHE